MRPLALLLLFATAASAQEFAWPLTPQYPSVYAPYLPPQTTHVEERPRYGLLATGLALFGATWLLNAAVAYVGDEGRLAIPIVGPLLYGEYEDRRRGTCLPRHRRRQPGCLCAQACVAQRGPGC